MTSAGVTSEAAGTPEETFDNGQNQGLLFPPDRLPQGSSQAQQAYSGMPQTQERKL